MRWFAPFCWDVMPVDRISQQIFSIRTKNYLLLISSQSLALSSLLSRLHFLSDWLINFLCRLKRSWGRRLPIHLSIIILLQVLLVSFCKRRDTQDNHTLLKDFFYTHFTSVHIFLRLLIIFPWSIAFPFPEVWQFEWKFRSGPDPFH